MKCLACGGKMEIWGASVASPFAPAKCGSCGHVRQFHTTWIGWAIVAFILIIVALAVLIPLSG
jgi:hypothetical protein